MAFIKHIGTPRHSGRYPWGSGESGYQRNKSFIGYVRDLKRQGLSDTEIAKGLGMSVNELRERRSIAVKEKRAADASEALRLKEKGYSDSAIGKRMGVNESTVRSWLNPSLREKADSSAMTALILKDNVDSKGFIDIGSGVEQHLGVKRPTFNTAVAMLKEEGYVTNDVYIEQLGTGKYTITKVLGPPGTNPKDFYKNINNIKLAELKTVTDYSEDGGKTFRSIEPVKSVDSSRVLIKYKEDGGAEKDGIIELRRGVDDLSLGGKNYAQVRIGVDGTHFMKGMAIYSDSIPKGFDIVYNVNKPKGSNKDDIFKPMIKKDGEIDTENPFKSSIRQKHYIDSEGKEHLSAINVVGYKEGSGEEGSWADWSRNLSSQVLSKQSPYLAKKQLKMAYDLKKEEFDEIMSITNPTVKKTLLKQFSDSCDSDAVHLKGAALPRQATHVLLTFKSIKENEIYAPNYNDGEYVVLIRHPHGGIFEIPELKVNNKNAEAKRVISSKSEDAVGIHPKTASILSGADFDGDAVLVIPNKDRTIRRSNPLQQLTNFDPKVAYPKYDGMRIMDKRTKGLEMGKISNLITDMTIRGADRDEIARAVRHSMVVIDAEKHKLNYQQSYIDNNIADLKKKYQGSERSGASTIISRSTAEKRIPERREGQIRIDPLTGKAKRVYIDPKTGKKLYEETGKTYLKRGYKIDPATGKKVYYEIDPSTGQKRYYDPVGKALPRLQKVKRMAIEEDAFKLSSGTEIENIYATHANSLKDLGNQARLAILKTKDIPYSKSARTTYKTEVASLSSKLSLSYRNKPLERQAQLLANKMISAKRKANPNMDSDDLKKIKGEELEKARARFGAKKADIKITDREWEAIQAGAITPSFLKNILDNTDSKMLKERALPRYKLLMSPARIARAKEMLNRGYTPAEIANSLGVSATTVVNAVKG